MPAGRRGEGEGTRVRLMKKKLIILGGGESGVGAALLGMKEGYDVLLFDESSLNDGYRNELTNAGISFMEKEIADEELLSADEVVKSPGMPEKYALQFHRQL